jgi:hypothetical protein
MASPKDKINKFKEKFNKTLSRGNTYLGVEDDNEEKEETLEELQREMNEALPVDLSDPKFSKEENVGDPKKRDPKKNKLIMKPGQLGGKRKTKKMKRKPKKGKKSRKVRKSKKTKKMRKGKKKRRRTNRKRR